MKIIVCAIHDSAMNAHMQPLFVPTTQVAVRHFSDLLNNPESAISKHPSDYTLWQLGVYDDEAGDFLNDRQRLIRAVDLQQGTQHAPQPLSIPTSTTR